MPRPPTSSSPPIGSANSTFHIHVTVFPQPGLFLFTSSSIHLSSSALLNPSLAAVPSLLSHSQYYDCSFTLSRSPRTSLPFSPLYKPYTCDFTRLGMAEYFAFVFVLRLVSHQHVRAVCILCERHILQLSLTESSLSRRSPPRGRSAQHGPRGGARDLDALCAVVRVRPVEQEVGRERVHRLDLLRLALARRAQRGARQQLRRALYMASARREWWWWWWKRLAWS